jgi:DAK2 domain fusion protein YloV
VTSEQETRPPVGHVVLCEGRGLKRLMEAGLAWLEHNHQRVNALNVFPVPDGDTGTNMMLTMRSAYSEIVDNDTRHVGKIAQGIAHGALMGARGNSGVILSQIWRGFAREIEDLVAFNVQQFAVAMRRASDTAYKGVVKPVEGTILTVIRQAAEAAEIAAQSTDDLTEAFRMVVNRCHQAVQETPRLLQVLADAGVVDAGGEGLTVVLEGMLRYLRGEAIWMTEGVEAEDEFERALAPHTGEEEYNYDVQFIIKGHTLDVLLVREKIDAMGDSTLVVGDENTIKVHVHVDDPGLPISYGASQGTLLDVVVENMHEQYQEFVRSRAAAAAAPATVPMIVPKQELVHGQVAVIAVAPGQGITQVFESLGVARVVAGGQTMNPSTEEILRAIEEVGTDRIIVLPNNKNIIMAAKNACELSSKQARVVPTRTVPQGVNALLMLDPDGELDDIVAGMETAAAEVATGEITTATRDVELDGVQVQVGQVLGLANGKVCCADPDICAVVRTTLTLMDIEDRELLTLYFGSDTSAQDAEEMASHIQGWHPHLEVEVVDGGQPHYFYIISAE